MPWLIGHVFYICPIYNPSRAPCGVTTASRKEDLTSALCSEGPPSLLQTVRFVPGADANENNLW